MSVGGDQERRTSCLTRTVNKYYARTKCVDTALLLIMMYVFVINKLYVLDCTISMKLPGHNARRPHTRIRSLSHRHNILMKILFVELH